MSDKPKWLQHAVEFIIDNFTILATLVTAAYITFRQSFAQTKLSTDDLLAAIVGVLGLLALSEIIERYRRLGSLEKSNKRIVSLLESRLTDRASALAFFQKMPLLDEYVKNASQIDFCGVTLTSAVNRQLTNIKQRFTAGANVRILLIDPTSLALRMSNLRSEEPDSDYYSKRLDATFQDIEYLYNQWVKQNSTAKGNFSVRLLAYPPSFGIFSFDANRPTAKLLLEIYPHKTGYDAPPVFDLLPTRDGEWHKYFVEQFEAMWKDAKEWKPVTIEKSEESVQQRQS